MHKLRVPRITGNDLTIEVLPDAESVRREQKTSASIQLYEGAYRAGRVSGQRYEDDPPIFHDIGLFRDRVHRHRMITIHPEIADPSRLGRLASISSVWTITVALLKKTLQPQ